MIPVCVAGYFFPGQCIQFGFRYRLLLRVLLPTLLLIVIPLCTIAFFYCHRARGHGTRSRWLRDALEVAAPFDLFICFLLCPTVSKGIFDTWVCTEYDLNGATASVRTFLNADRTNERPPPSQEAATASHPTRCARRALPTSCKVVSTT